jgi:alanine dehydrogenase
VIVGVPKEIKEGEHRVALTPEGAQALRRDGHDVRVQTNAGEASGFPDADYRRLGARIVSTAVQAWDADLVVKVKEPQATEYRFFRSHHTLFTFLHLAPNPKLTRALLKSKTTAIAYETVEENGGKLPILQSMSEIAGRVAVLMGAYFQGNPQGGRGVLFGAMAGVAPAHVVILGGGTVGETAARVALAMGSRVTVLERRNERRQILNQVFQGSVELLPAEPAIIETQVRSADVLIGATHMPGAKTPRLVNRSLVKKMKSRSVIIDVAIDQGGSCETSHPTSHLKPTYFAEGVLHYCVPNMPGAYARTATQALTHATLPYISTIAREGIPDVFAKSPGLAKGLQCYQGHLTSLPVAQAQHLQARSLMTLQEGS